MPPAPPLAWPVEPYRRALDAIGALRTLAREERRLGVLVGAPGSGKTFAVREFCRSVPEAHFCTVPPRQVLTVRSLLAAIAEGTGLPSAYGMPPGRHFDELCQVLRTFPVFLFIDEADRLTQGNVDLIRSRVSPGVSWAAPSLILSSLASRRRRVALHCITPLRR